MARTAKPKDSVELKNGEEDEDPPGGLQLVLGKNYMLTSTTLNIILNERKLPCKDGKPRKRERDNWKAIGYYTRIGPALVRDLAERKFRKSEVIGDIKAGMKRLAEIHEETRREFIEAGMGDGSD